MAMRPYLLVSGDFVRTGGMDIANYSLASHLADRGGEVHLVTHRAEKDLAERPNVFVHRAPKPLRSYLLGGPLLDFEGRRWAARIAARGGRVLVNGGNCQWGDANWVHYVHAVHEPQGHNNLVRAVKAQIQHQVSRSQERTSIRKARMVIANSRRTRQDLIERLQLDERRIHLVYLGVDPDLFRPPSPEERAAARNALGWHQDRLKVVFIGALGDLRKGFDTLFRAWIQLCSDQEWTADLVVVGAGSQLSAWRDAAEASGFGNRFEFLGFRRDVPTILAAADASVSPTRYESYGLGIHEALCAGLPAFVTQSAGVAERYSSDLRELLFGDPAEPADVAARLKAWAPRREQYRRAVLPVSALLRSHTWERMSAQIVDCMEQSA